MLEDTATHLVDRLCHSVVVLFVVSLRVLDTDSYSIGIVSISFEKTLIPAPVFSIVSAK